MALTYKSSTIPARPDLPAAFGVQSVLTARVQRVDILAGPPAQPETNSTISQPEVVATFN